LQQAFIDNAAVQCGYCAPGMLLSAKALLDKNPDPSEREIREGIAGNICRCTGYVKIVKAVQQAAIELQQLERGVPSEPAFGAPGCREHEGSYR
jgi:carbon-monoxide dehydrogenase small subunit